MRDTERYRQQAIATLAKHLGQPKETFECKGSMWYEEEECWLLTVPGSYILYQVVFHVGRGIWHVTELDLTGMF